MRNHRRAVLFGTITIVAVVSLGISFTTPPTSPEIEQKTLQTADELQSLKLALTSYVGTMGSKPAVLSELWVKGSKPELTFSTTHNVGAGWIGPYITDDIVEHLANRDKDRFGSELKYTSKPFKRSTDDEEIAIRVQSAGPDRVMDNDDDLISDTLTSELFATVTGRVLRRGDAAKSVGLTLNVPKNGIPYQIRTQTDADGTYTFSDVPLGFRSITLDDGPAKLRRMLTVNVRRQVNMVPDIILAGTK